MQKNMNIKQGTYSCNLYKQIILIYNIAHYVLWFYDSIHTCSVQSCMYMQCLSSFTENLELIGVPWWNTLGTSLIPQCFASPSWPGRPWTLQMRIKTMQKSSKHDQTWSKIKKKHDQKSKKHDQTSWNMFKHVQTSSNMYRLYSLVTQKTKTWSAHQCSPTCAKMTSKSRMSCTWASPNWWYDGFVLKWCMHPYTPH